MSVTVNTPDDVICGLQLSESSLTTDWLNDDENEAWHDIQHQNQLTYEALDDVDAGNFVSHDDVQKWAVSLNSERYHTDLTSILSAITDDNIHQCVDFGVSVGNEML